MDVGDIAAVENRSKNPLKCEQKFIDTQKLNRKQVSDIKWHSYEYDLLESFIIQKRTEMTSVVQPNLSNLGIPCNLE